MLGSIQLSLKPRAHHAIVALHPLEPVQDQFRVPVVSTAGDLVCPKNFANDEMDLGRALSGSPIFWPCEVGHPPLTGCLYFSITRRGAGLQVTPVNCHPEYALSAKFRRSGLPELSSPQNSSEIHRTKSCLRASLLYQFWPSGPSQTFRLARKTECLKINRPGGRMTCDWIHSALASWRLCRSAIRC